ncbi:MAG: hypothetical protein ABSH10_09365 [Phycisphaerae bacterium]|jgi:hypothetical protein
MKKLFILILLGGAFFSGYYTGRMPGAPDLMPYIEKGYAEASVAYHYASRWIRSEIDKQNAARCDPTAVAAADQTNGDQPQQENYGP